MKMTMDKFGVPEEVLLPRPDGSAATHHSHLARIDVAMDQTLNPYGFTAILGFVERERRTLLECTVQSYPAKQGHHRLLLRFFDLTPNREKSWFIEEPIAPQSVIDWASLIGLIKNFLPKLYQRIDQVPSGDPMPDEVLRQRTAMAESSESAEPSAAESALPARQSQGSA